MKKKQTQPKFYNEISQFEPLMPAETGELEDLAFELTKKSAGLAGELPAATLAGVRELLRIINSYYSNLIEGHNTHPIDVERAMHQDYSIDPAKRDRQKESLVHIDVQKKIDSRLEAESHAKVAGMEFLTWIHREFYERMPEDLCWVEDELGKKERVVGGEIRRRPVAVGKHLPPTSESIEAFMDRFGEYYDPERIHGMKKFVAIAAAHHRLMWIHPFLDGNGRVARLHTDAFFQRIGLDGYGLWNVSRGFARRNADYKRYLDAADFPREDDLDGRGNLSNRTLTEFCKFFLEVCVDQASYMTSILNLSDLLPRIDNYVARRAQALVVDERGVKAEALHPSSSMILREAAIYGELPRSRIPEIIGLGDRSATKITKALLDECLLVPSSDWHRSTVRIGFPPHAAGHWFPNLFPDIEPA